MTTELSIALERYDRHVPFFMDMVATPPDADFTLRALEVGMAPPRRDGIDRHARFMKGDEFDICEMSVSSYLTAKSRGAPYTAVPVFPRRLSLYLLPCDLTLAHRVLEPDRDAGRAILHCAVPHDRGATDDCRHGPACHVHAVEGRPAAFADNPVIGDGPGFL